MKKQITGAICAVAMVLTVPTSTFAAEAGALPDPGMTPVSRFYFAEAWLQHMNMRLTFNAEARVQKAMRYADERLAEMEAMAEQNRAREMERAAEEFRYCLNLAAQNMERVQAQTLAQITNQLQVENSTPSEVPVQSTVQELERDFHYGGVDQATPSTSGGQNGDAGYGQSGYGASSGHRR